MHLPSVDSIQCFLAVARHLNFRKAALEISLTPAAVGQRVRQLEETFEVELFTRSTRKVNLTPAGFRLVPVAQKFIATASECIEAARGKTAPLPITLSLGTRHELGASWIMPILPLLEKAFPHITLNIYCGSGEDILNRIRNRDIDCGITSTRYQDASLEFQALHKEEYVFVGAPKLLQAHPLKKESQATSHTLIDIAPQLPLFTYFNESSTPHPKLKFGKYRHMGSIDAIRDTILREQGVGILPLYLVKKDLKSGKLKPIFQKVKLQHDYFKFLYRKDDARSSVFEALATEMLKYELK